MFRIQMLLVVWPPVPAPQPGLVRTARGRSTADGDTLSALDTAIWLGASARREVLERGDQVAREDSVAIRLPQDPLRQLPRDDGLPSGGGAHAGRHERPNPALDVDGAVGLERPIGVLNGVRIDLQLGRELTHCRQRFPRLQQSHRNAPPNLVPNLPEHRPPIVRIDGH